MSQRKEIVVKANEIIENADWDHLIGLNVTGTEILPSLRLLLGNDRTVMEVALDVLWSRCQHGPTILPITPVVVQLIVALLEEWASEGIADSVSVDLIHFLGSVGRWLSIFQEQYSDIFANDAQAFAAELDSVGGDAANLDLGALEPLVEAASLYAGYQAIQLKEMVLEVLAKYESGQAIKEAENALTHWRNIDPATAP